VIGATVTSPRNSSVESRVRSKTGRRLSAGRNLYQRVSPRFISLSRLLVFLIGQLARLNRFTLVAQALFFLQLINVKLFEGASKRLAQ